MAGRIFRRPQVKLDVIESARFIARDDVDAALRFIDAVEATFEQLAALPDAGRLLEGLDPKLAGLRSRSVRGFGNWLVFYRPLGPGIEIVRVLHGARDLERALGGEPT